jgi:HEAT repeats
MRDSTWERGALGLGLAVLSLAAVARADEVTLKTGGVVRGQVTAKHAKTVDIKTAKGTLLVLDWSAVQEVKRSPSSAQKPVAGKAASKKSKLTAAQQAWIPKIRKLVSRLLSGDPERSRQARDELLKITNPDALPALARALQQDQDEKVRRLFVQIVAGMSASNSVYFLVAQSLFDPSEDVRDAARTAIGSQRADSARPLYINALKTGDVTFAARAALAIKEIGDPNGDAIPYLIDNLSTETKQTVQLSSYQLFDWVEQQGMNTGLRLVHVGYGSDYGGFAGGGGSGSGPQLGTPPRASAATAVASTTSNSQSPPNASWQLSATIQHLDVVRVKNVNPAVLEALVSIAGPKDPGHGYHKDNWRRWWTAEKRSRELQDKKPSVDHVMGR